MKSISLLIKQPVGKYEVLINSERTQNNMQRFDFDKKYFIYFNVYLFIYAILQS